jgi:hypothetical protein
VRAAHEAVPDESDAKLFHIDAHQKAQ